MKGWGGGGGIRKIMLLEWHNFVSWEENKESKGNTQLFCQIVIKFSDKGQLEDPTTGSIDFSVRFQAVVIV